LIGDPQRLVRIGKIARAHGIRGEVAIKPDESGSTTLLTQPRAWLKWRDGRVEPVEIASARTVNEGWLVRFANCPDRTAAEKFGGVEVFLPRECLPELEDGEFYADDLVGLRVESVSGEDLGKVTQVFDGGAVPVLEVEGRRSLQIPLVDTFVKRVDQVAGVVVVETPEEAG